MVGDSCKLRPKLAKFTAGIQRYTSPVQQRIQGTGAVVPMLQACLRRRTRMTSMPLRKNGAPP